MALSLSWIGPRLYQQLRNTDQMILGSSDETIRNGNWHGNDTCWRMVLDLNCALLYGNPDGTWREAGEGKKYLAIVDGIIGGEGNGPLCPDPVNSGVLIAWTNPAEIDAVAAKLMGFDPRKIPLISEAFTPHRWPIGVNPMENIEVRNEGPGQTTKLDQIQPVLPGGFRPHFGWMPLKACGS